jgi:hypothetical protein
MRLHMRLHMRKHDRLDDTPCDSGDPGDGLGERSRYRFTASNTSALGPTIPRSGWYSR